MEFSYSDLKTVLLSIKEVASSIKTEDISDGVAVVVEENRKFSKWDASLWPSSTFRPASLSCPSPMQNGWAFVTWIPKILIAILSLDLRYKCFINFVLSRSLTITNITISSRIFWCSLTHKLTYRLTYLLTHWLTDWLAYAKDVTSSWSYSMLVFIGVQRGGGDGPSPRPFLGHFS